MATPALAIAPEAERERTRILGALAAGGFSPPDDDALAEEQAAQGGQLSIGAIDDLDLTFVNGQPVIRDGALVPGVVGAICLLLALPLAGHGQSIHGAGL